jgi:subtilisin family serine protease
LAVGAAAALVTTMVAGGASGASAGTEPSAQIDGTVLAELAANGTAEFFVYFDERPSLAAAATISDRTSRTQFVYDTLTTAAAASQAGVTALLRAHGADFTSFWITNAILVQGDHALLQRLAAHPGVSAIGPNETVPLIQAVEWGVANINADQVWSQFGVTGEGIVVATIDTGVHFTHPALVNQYRGNLGGSFDHNYNWFDPAGICSPGVPCDNNGHGTHVTGTMVGDDGGTNQIGVAPGAKWIAAKGCESNSCSQSSLLASGQWMVAPTQTNGQNPDPSKAPHIVNNSWGGPGGNTWYAGIVDSWVAAGIFPMFSNGNSGPACGTAGSPGDYPQSYGVGAYSITNTIASFSSRGPSQVNGGIKPNISAPGVSVRSSVPTSGYSNFSGTSMASPHASGTVALVWSANSDFIGDISATRTVLDTTARDVSDLQCGGTADNNNVWGQGRIDALAAVDAVSDGEPPPPPPPGGTVTGTVTNSNGLPVGSGQVTLQGAGGTFNGTISSGQYTITDVVPGSYQVSATAQRCPSHSSSVSVTSGQTIVHNIQFGGGPRCGQ